MKKIKVPTVNQIVKDIKAQFLEAIARGVEERAWQYYENTMKNVNEMLEKSLKESQRKSKEETK